MLASFQVVFVQRPAYSGLFPLGRKRCAQLLSHFWIPKQIVLIELDLSIPCQIGLLKFVWVFLRPLPPQQVIDSKSLFTQPYFGLVVIRIPVLAQQLCLIFNLVASIPPLH